MRQLYSFAGGGDLLSANETTTLDEIKVSETKIKNGSAEAGYLVEETKGVGIWNERKLQDTPYSMSIISKDLIENVQAKDMNQIFKMNPTTQEAGNNNVLGDVEAVGIRGFTISNPIVNGISYPNENSYTPMMQDIERVEIINGATGFLYGGGRVGGAVNYITKKPTTKDLKNITIGSYGNESYYTHLDLGGQFDEDNTFGYRVNALYQNGELPDTSEKEQKNISLVFDWKPTDKFYTDIKYSHTDELTKGANLFFNTIDDRSSIKTNKMSSPNWIQQHMKSDRFENNIIYDINDIFTLRTNIFYEELNFKGGTAKIEWKDNKINLSPDTFTWVHQATKWGKTKNNGMNVYLDSDFDTKNINHTLTIGYSLNSSKFYELGGSYFREPFVGTLDEFKSIPKPNAFTQWDRSPITTSIRKLANKTQYRNILIGDDIVFNENWSALVGANYATVEQFLFWSGANNYNKSELTPTLSLIYKPFENLTTYLTYIESLEAGTVVGSTYANANEILDPYKSTQYEIGAKYSLFDEKALLTASLFRIEKANSYDDESTIVTLGKPTLTQDGEQIHQGIELGITGKVTDNFTLIAGGTLMDLSVEKATNTALEGKKPTNAATKMAKLFAEYQIPYVNGLSINAGAYYTGKRYANEVNTDILPSYTLYDAGLRYKTKIDKYPTTFNLTVQNLTDEVYWTYSSQLGDPRTVAISLKMEF